MPAKVAEGEGFKPPIPERGIPDFESSAIDHSANLPFFATAKLAIYFQLQAKMTVFFVCNHLIVKEQNIYGEVGEQLADFIRQPSELFSACSFLSCTYISTVPYLYIYKRIRPVISTGLIYILTKTKLTTKKTNLLYCCFRNISWYLALVLSTICFQGQK